MSALWDSGVMVRQPAWHGLGTVIDYDIETWGQFRQLAGLEWDPVEEPLFGFSGMEDDGTVIYAQEEGIKKIVRSDTSFRLGVVGEGYAVIDHNEMGEIADLVLRSKGIRGFRPRIETGGSLDEGRKVWVLFQLGEPMEIPGDPSPTLPFAAFLNAHDGTGALKAFDTNIRVVCANTYSAAEADADQRGSIASIRHTKSWKDRVTEVEQALAGAAARAEIWQDWATTLTGFPVTDEQFDEFVLAHFWPKDMTARITDRVRGNIEEAERTFRGFYNSPTCEGIRGNAWGLASALSEYAGYGRGFRSNDKNEQRDSLTNRTIFSQEGYIRSGMRTLGELIGAQLV